MSTSIETVTISRATFEEMAEAFKREKERGVFPDLNDENSERIGERIAEVLDKNPKTSREWTGKRYNTSHGTKTATGLARTVAALFFEKV